MGSERELALNLAGTDAVLRAVISTCLGQYRRCEARLLADADNEAVHQTRVSLRRLRSAPADGDDAARHRLRKRVKKLRHAGELLGGLFRFGPACTLHGGAGAAAGRTGRAE